MWITVVWALIKTAAVAAVVWAIGRAASRAGRAGGLTMVLVVAFALRLAWIIAVHPELSGDAAWYHLRAQDLASHLQYTIDGRPTARLPPGFPVVLAMLYAVAGPWPVLGVGLNLCLTVATVGLVYAVARRLFDEPTALVAALITAVWPGQVPYASVLLSEPLFGVLFLLGFLLTLRAMRTSTGPMSALLAGVCFGLAALTRPVALLVAPLASLVVGSQARGVRKGVGAGLMLMLGATVVIAPWVIRNYRVFGHFVPVTSSAGIALWQGNNPSTTMLPSDARIEPYEELADREVERDLLASRDAKAFIRAHPLQAFRFFVGKADRTFESDSEVAESSLATGRPLPGGLTTLYLHAGSTYFHAMMILFCGFVVIACLPGSAIPRASSFAVIVPVLYCVALQAPFISQYRYTYPALPFIAIGAAVVVQRCGAWSRA